MKYVAKYIVLLKEKHWVDIIYQSIIKQSEASGVERGIIRIERGNKGVERVIIRIERVIIRIERGNNRIERG